MRVLVGTVFLIALVSKVASRRAFAAFAGSVAELSPLPASASRSLAYAVAAGEFLVCLLLVMPAPLAAGLGFAWAAALLLAFAVAVGCAVARGSRSTCRCFGASTAPLGVRHVVRNLVLAVGAAGAAAVTQTTGSGHPAGLVIAALAGLLLGGLLAALDSIVDLFRPVRPLRPVRSIKS
ncbi:MAG TPA: MauE/DoxX family redox-associated membrane protein [Streptomyces sp.]|nr:MauE/DoxX family redox-associated membrane protein [Streptomyces sp.]